MWITQRNIKLATKLLCTNTECDYSRKNNDCRGCSLLTSKYQQKKKNSHLKLKKTKIYFWNMYIITAESNYMLIIMQVNLQCALQKKKPERYQGIREYILILRFK